MIEKLDEVIGKLRAKMYEEIEKRIGCIFKEKISKFKDIRILGDIFSLEFKEFEVRLETVKKKIKENKFEEKYDNFNIAFGVGRIVRKKMTLEDVDRMRQEGTLEKTRSKYRKKVFYIFKEQLESVVQKEIYKLNKDFIFLEYKVSDYENECFEFSFKIEIKYKIKYKIKCYKTEVAINDYR